MARTGRSRIGRCRTPHTFHWQLIRQCGDVAKDAFEGRFLPFLGVDHRRCCDLLRGEEMMCGNVCGNANDEGTMRRKRCLLFLRNCRGCGRPPRRPLVLWFVLSLFPPDGSTRRDNRRRLKRRSQRRGEAENGCAGAIYCRGVVALVPQQYQTSRSLYATVFVDLMHEVRHIPAPPPVLWFVDVQVFTALSDTSDAVHEEVL